MARIIILAQPTELFSFIEHVLIREGYSVRLVHDPTLAATKINALLPDLVIVDAAGSPSTTLELCIRIRNRRAIGRTLILILGSAADAVASGIFAMEGNTYLERPLQPDVLIARVRALLGSRIVAKSKSQIVVTDLVIDPASCQVTRSGKLLPLTLIEFRLLHYLASHPNIVCRRDRLLDVIWENPRAIVPEVDLCIRHLREKIEQDPKKPRLIRSVHTQGYRFHVPATPSSP